MNHDGAVLQAQGVAPAGVTMRTGAGSSSAGGASASVGLFSAASPARHPGTSGAAGPSGARLEEILQEPPRIEDADAAAEDHSLMVWKQGCIERHRELVRTLSGRKRARGDDQDDAPDVQELDRDALLSNS